MIKTFLVIISPRQKAPRAGTPGFRSPEVLMRYPKQSTGKNCTVIFILLCVLSAYFMPSLFVRGHFQRLITHIRLFFIGRNRTPFRQNI